MLRIVADQNIMAAEAAFGPLGELRLLPAAAITPGTAADADVLLIRSVTPIDRRFAALPNLRFVGTATIGTDHMDTAALRAAGIAVHHSPACNADSVVEYVIAALLHAAVRQGGGLRGRTVGVVGCGNIGARVARRLAAFGCSILRNDPPLAERAEREGREHGYVPLAQVLAEADVLTLHVPFTREGPHPTRHLLGARELAALRPDAWLLNTARGAVVDNGAWRASLERGRPAVSVVDVWEHEPRIDLALLERAALATPHIAGHSFDGKLNGTIMLHDALVREFGLVSGWDAERAAAPTAEDRLLLEAPAGAGDTDADEARWLHALVGQMYDIGQDDARMRAALLGRAGAELPEAFQELRRSYPRRRTFARHSLSAAALPPPLLEPVRDGLRIGLRQE